MPRPTQLLHPSHSPAPTRAAATLLLLRDGAEGLEVLLTRRSAQARFAPGAYVFPGGAVDEADDLCGVEARLAVEREPVEDDEVRGPVAAHDGVALPSLARHLERGREVGRLAISYALPPARQHRDRGRAPVDGTGSPARRAITISGRITPARICVAPFTLASRPSNPLSSAKVRAAIAMSPKPSR